MLATLLINCHVLTSEYFQISSHHLYYLKQNDPHHVVDNVSILIGGVIRKRDWWRALFMLTEDFKDYILICSIFYVRHHWRTFWKPDDYHVSVLVNELDYPKATDNLISEAICYSSSWLMILCFHIMNSTSNKPCQHWESLLLAI